MLPGLRAIVAIVLLALTFPAAAAQDSARRSTFIPWQQWLDEPDRYDLKWEVTVSPSRQTYDLRHLVLINIEVPENTLAAVSAKPDLHLLIKAGDNERWYEPEDYAHIAPEQLGEKLTIQFLSALYLPSGHYRLGIILLDAATQRRSVVHRSITIPAEKDSLASLDDRLPPVEIASVSRSEAPGQPWKAAGGRTGHHPRVAQEPMLINERSAITMLARQPDPRSLPLRSQVPLEIDVLVNFTPTATRENSNAAYSISESDMWGILRVLALIKPPTGCVLMTGIDVLGQKVIFSRVEAATVNWEALADSVSSIDANTVELQMLEAHRRMSQFFRAQVSQLLDTTSHCRRLPNDAEHVYIIAADGVSFPAGTVRAAIEGAPGRPVRLYYFRRGNVWDEMERIVKPLHPHHLNADTPEKFRRSLERLIRELGGLQ